VRFVYACGKKDELVSRTTLVWLTQQIGTSPVVYLLLNLSRAPKCACGDPFSIFTIHPLIS
jgi:hypothetical protein